MAISLSSLANCTCVVVKANSAAVTYLGRTLLLNDGSVMIGSASICRQTFQEDQLQ